MPPKHINSYALVTTAIAPNPVNPIGAYLADTGSTQRAGPGLGPVHWGLGVLHLCIKFVPLHARFEVAAPQTPFILRVVRGPADPQPGCLGGGSPPEEGLEGGSPPDFVQDSRSLAGPCPGPVHYADVGGLGAEGLHSMPVPCPARPDLDYH
jgi:hypothetical protein